MAFRDRLTESGRHRHRYIHLAPDLAEGEAMMESASQETGSFQVSWNQRKERLCDQFEKAWSGSPRPRIEDYLGNAVDPQRSELLQELLALELELRVEGGEEPTVDEYARRFPEHAALVQTVFRSAGCLPLESIGRYRVRCRLGGGGFGQVYLCYDDRAEREVAIKVPRRNRLTSEEAEQGMLHEARSVARLNHGGIVTLFDVGEHEGQCFLVYQYIEGLNLAQLLKQGPVLQDQAAQLVAQVADTLHYAHGQNLYHRDIKPANILLDRDGHPYVTDFGLAILDEDVPREGARRCGTYPYMAPEQVRGEGHRIDGRTDIYSLGVVLYELLCDRRPFLGSNSEVSNQIVYRDPRPPRQIKQAIDPDLERICLKALAKQMSARYPTAGDMAEDLRAVTARSPRPVPDLDAPTIEMPTVADPAARRRPAVPPPVRVVPKGLRSFGPQDSAFFLELLPGLRDRDGLPDAIRFWKTRLESRDADSTFSVGLIYGPSGCGKSSLIRAGLLPRLSSSVLPVYVEATRDGTVPRLAKALKTACKRLDMGSPLPAMLAQFRRSRTLRSRAKLVIVLDQFEQWLHAHGQDMESTELAAALRQCNGEDVQVLLLTRDDFWMGISRFFDGLEIPLDRARNARAVDLFDANHARHVLRLFGQAYDRLPAEPAELSPDQANFLNRTVAELSQDGRVVPVRLSLFADLMKERSWTSATLLEVGGAEGVGVRFLEETFTARSALPDHRAMEKPARALLQALLPEHGTDIKGRMRSRQMLAEAAGLAEGAPRFGRLLELLDRDLHLITPTESEPDGTEGQGPGTRRDVDSQDPVSPLPAAPQPAPIPEASFYQLTHDYLVAPLRKWLTQEKGKTWTGRAELCLEERTAQWSRTPARRFLPSTLEYLRIVLAVPRRKQTSQQHAMLRAAAWCWGTRWGSTLAVLVVVLFVVHQYVSSVRNRGREESTQTEVHALLSMPAEAVPLQIERLRQYQDLARPALQTRFQESSADPRERLRAACALLVLPAEDLRDRQLVEEARAFLVQAITRAPAGECKNIVFALQPAQGEVLEQLRQRARDNRADDAIRVRYATVLLHLGEPGPAREILAARPDPTRRTIFLHSFNSWHGDLRPLARILQTDDEPAFTSGLCAAVGLIDPESLDRDEVRDMKSTLLHLYQNAFDSGTHSAAAWALHQWKTPRPALESAEGTAGKRDWFVNKQGMTLLRLPAGTFVMGDLSEKGHWLVGASTAGLLASPQGRGPFLVLSATMPARSLLKVVDAPTRVTLTRSLLISDRAVSRAQFQQFMDDPKAEKDPYWPGSRVDVSPTMDCPVQMVNWYDALLYCNWLSDQDGLTRCYERTGVKEQVGTPPGAEKVVCDVWHFKAGANGYRLPTEAEREYACRAGTTTPYCFGADASRLSSYCISRDIHTVAAGSRLPNAWGLFDMHGNVMEWCWDRFAPHSGAPAIDPQGSEQGTDRTARGGYFAAPPELCTSSARARATPTIRTATYGFRVVRMDP
jgi:serine/threonine protein kinase/formylglycine-generating enzyme required for sulfatase activity